MAGRLEWDPSKLSRIENRQVGIIARDLRKLLDLYAVTDESQREGYFAMAREGKQRAWWQSYGDVIPSEYGTLIGLESEAATISNYEQELIPGLLQTEDYARAVIRVSRPDDTAEQVSRRAEVRMARQQVLARDDAPRLWAVINEAAVRRVVGGPAVMAAQLRSLAAARDRAVVTVQVLPFSSGEHPAMTGSFVTLDFAAPDPGAVYLENAASALYLERPADVAWYTEAFRFVQAAALGPKETRDISWRQQITWNHDHEGRRVGCQQRTCPAPSGAPAPAAAATATVSKSPRTSPTSSQSGTLKTAPARSLSSVMPTGKPLPCDWATLLLTN